MADTKSSPAPEIRWSHSEYESPITALESARKACVDISDIIVCGACDDFQAEAGLLHIGPAVLIEFTTTELNFSRKSAHIARSATDHYQINLFLNGGYQTRCNDQVHTVKTGDVGFMDMANESQTELCGSVQSGYVKCITLFFPRHALAPLLRNPDSVHNTVISRHTAYGRFLADQILLVHHYASYLTADENEAVAQAIAIQIAGALGPVGASGQPVERENPESLLHAIKDFIALHANDDDIGTEMLCQHFAMSRASIYRIFEPEDGLIHFLQQCRLKRALSLLISQSHSHLRIVDIAMECQFNSDVAFIRAFRRQFTLTPGQVRALAKSRLAGRHPTDAKASHDIAQEFVSHILDLAQKRTE